MRKIFFLFSLITFLFTSSIWAADISGTWVLKYTGHSGDERALDMVIKASGENLTVTATHPSLGEMAGTGTLKGNDITMTLMATGEREVGFELKGTVTGNKMAGTKETKVAERDESEGAQGGRGDSSGSGREGAEMGARGNSSGGDQSGSKRPDRSESSGGDKASSQRPARSDSSASASGAGPSGAPGSDSSKAKEISNAWTAEKK